MIVEERMRAYINALDTGNTPFLEELERFALENEVPIIRKEMQSFMKVLLAVKRPMQVLEVGTAVGFSTLLMCEYGQPDMHITTIENYEKRIPIARENFRKAGREHRITFLTGDAGEILPTLSGRYDLIFMDSHMPKMDGKTATKKIRAMTDGMNDYIMKPVDSKMLCQKIRKYLPDKLIMAKSNDIQEYGK